VQQSSVSPVHTKHANVRPIRHTLHWQAATDAHAADHAATAAVGWHEIRALPTIVTHAFGSSGLRSCGHGRIKSGAGMAPGADQGVETLGHPGRHGRSSAPGTPKAGHGTLGRGAPDAARRHQLARHLHAAAPPHSNAGMCVSVWRRRHRVDPPSVHIATLPTGSP